ncbi:MAG: Osmosensitive channel His kinase sensor [Sporolactobacillus laevolacticus]|jgi:two-component system sensor histidine kinase KdpD|nr:Osmosensitive channel His kinase sensor [Sporolactobacillus laevolacticus]
MNDSVHENTEPKNPSKKGRLKIFVGAAPWVGKTYKMLQEAWSMHENHVDVVIGYVENHERRKTSGQIKSMEIIPRKTFWINKRKFEEMDVEAIVERRPNTVVVDELAHTNVAGSKFNKRYMDVAFLLEQGINVLATINVQHFEDVSNEAEKITKTKVRETVPRSFIDSADEIEMIDVPPETIRERLREEKLSSKGALRHFFKKENLSALRELTLRTVADTVDDRFQKSYERTSIHGPVGVKEAILVCTSFLQRSAKLIRKGYRITRALNADLYVLTIIESKEQDLPLNDKERLEKLRQLTHFCHASFIVESRNDRSYGDVMIDVAHRCNATQIVLGQENSSKKWFFHFRSPINYLLKHLRYVDVQVIGWKEENRPSSFKSNTNDNRERNPLNGSQYPGRLTVYIGAAPGVGKTYQMLQDANDMLLEGKDVVIGVIETHGRKETFDQIRQLPAIVEKKVQYNGHLYRELNIEEIIKRKPEIVVIDELAHTNIPGSAREKRYQDIIYLLKQGIHVMTAVNIQHIESLRDIVEHITGIRVRERVPDSFIDLADQVKMIDITPQALQQRLVLGKIYAKDKIEQSISNFFRMGNLSALRELALLEVADDVDQKLDDLRGHFQATIKKSKILVCVKYRPHSEKLIRRGWRMADRHHADLFVMAVITSKQMTDRENKDLEKLRALSEQFNAVFMIKYSTKKDLGKTIVKTAEYLQAERIIMGQPLSKKQFLAWPRFSPVYSVLRHATFVNLQIVADSRNELQ